MTRNRTTLGTAGVAELAGIHRDTLLRWLREGLISEPSRDRRGWRVFTATEAERIREFAQSGQNSLPAQEYGNAVRRLLSLDWSFADAKTSYLTHGLHPYPAKYIPQIPNALIQELSATGEVIGDVFCGSGTTLVEALLLKRHAVGIDASPLACLIAEAKTSRIATPERAELLQLAEYADRLAAELAPGDTTSLFGTRTLTSEHWRPEGDDLAFWFEPAVIEELAELRGRTAALTSLHARRLALVCLSSIVVTVSKQDSDTRYVRREKVISQGDTSRRFAKSLRKAVRAVSELNDIIEPRFSCNVIQSDILKAPPVQPLDLLVCSPPYPNAFSYHLYHRTRMMWLQMDQPAFKRVEIGSHRKYSAKGKNSATIETFRAELHGILGWLRTIVRVGRHACFVVGPSTIAGVRYDNAAILTEVALAEGFASEARIGRQLLATKKAFNPSHGSITSEDIVVLRNVSEDAPR